MITKINLCVMGAPLHPYIKEGEGEVRPAQGVRLEESYYHRE